MIEAEGTIQAHSPGYVAADDLIFSTPRFNKMKRARSGRRPVHHETYFFARPGSVKSTLRAQEKKQAKFRPDSERISPFEIFRTFWT